MRPWSPLSLVGTVLLAISACAVTRPLPPAKVEPVFDAARADRPIWRIGDRWTYKSLHLAQPDWRIDQVVRVEADHYVIGYWLPGADHPRRVGEDRLTHTLAVVRETRSAHTIDYSPPLEWYRWPLEIRKKWTVEVAIFIQAGPQKITRNLVSFDVEAYEEITVPAGTFKAFKIRALVSGFPPLGQFFHDEHLRWYAPAVKNFVRVEFPVVRDRVFLPPEVSVRGWELMQFEPERPKEPDDLPLPVACPPGTYWMGKGCTSR